VIIVTARDEAERIGATLEALAAAFPRSHIVLADDGSRDSTVDVAVRRGVEVVSAGTRRGKGQAASLGCARALELGGENATYLLCDGDLGASAALLTALSQRVDGGEADMAIGVLEPSRRAGFGVLASFARAAVRRSTGTRLQGPLSGQRALNDRTLRQTLPFSRGFGMELAMTIDALRAGARVLESQLALEHRWTDRRLAGFRHRAGQFRACLAVYLRRL